MARPRLFERIKAGFEAALEGECREITVWMPDPAGPYGSAEVAKIRADLCMTQIEFSQLLNVSVKTVEAWEQGLRPPSAAAARLLQVIADPDAFSKVVHNRRKAAMTVPSSCPPTLSTPSRHPANLY